MTTALNKAIAKAKESGDWNHLVEAIPYLSFIGFSVRREGEGIICELAANPILIGNPLIPALHGGVVGAFLESTALVQLLWESETARIPKTIDFSVDYLRSARPVQTYAQGVVTKHGRRVANVRVEAWQQSRDKPVAAAHAHMLLT
jgi:uncharacterized protein (TIGR00369 family)